MPQVPHRADLGEEPVPADVEAPPVALHCLGDPADLGGGLHHGAGHAVLGELVRRGQPGRSGADDHRAGCVCAVTDHLWPSVGVGARQGRGSTGSGRGRAGTRQGSGLDRVGARQGPGRDGAPSSLAACAAQLLGAPSAPCHRPHPPGGGCGTSGQVPYPVLCPDPRPGRLRGVNPNHPVVPVGTASGSGSDPLPVGSGLDSGACATPSPGGGSGDSLSHPAVRSVVSGLPGEAVLLRSCGSRPPSGIPTAQPE